MLRTYSKVSNPRDLNLVYGFILLNAKMSQKLFSLHKCTRTRTYDTCHHCSLTYGEHFPHCKIENQRMLILYVLIGSEKVMALHIVLIPLSFFPLKNIKMYFRIQGAPIWNQFCETESGSSAQSSGSKVSRIAGGTVRTHRELPWMRCFFSLKMLVL